MGPYLGSATVFGEVAQVAGQPMNPATRPQENIGFRSMIRAFRDSIVVPRGTASLNMIAHTTSMTSRLLVIGTLISAFAAATPLTVTISGTGTGSFGGKTFIGPSL